jgi:hypothetical protein
MTSNLTYMVAREPAGDLLREAVNARLARHTIRLPRFTGQRPRAGWAVEPGIHQHKAKEQT